MPPHRWTGGSKRPRDSVATDTIEEIERSEVARRGGAVPNGRKWAAVAAKPGALRYVVANAPRASRGSSRTAPSAAQPPPAGRGRDYRGAASAPTEDFMGVQGEFEPELEAITRAVQEMRRPGSAADCPDHHRARPRRRISSARGEGADSRDRRKGSRARVLPPISTAFRRVEPDVSTTSRRVERAAHMAMGAEWSGDGKARIASGRGVTSSATCGARCRRGGTGGARRSGEVIDRVGGGCAERPPAQGGLPRGEP